MIINRENERKTENVEFVSYTGKYPNLCSGVLTLKICGEECVFGHNSRDYDYKTGHYKDGNYDAFWSSGGSAGFNGGYSNSYVNQGEWHTDVEALPEKFKKYADEIDRVFNDNVEHGCCGGCL